MRRSLLIVGGIILASVVAVAVWQPWAMTRAQWLAKTARELRACGPPAPEFVGSLRPGQWVSQKYLLFSNDWACFAYNTCHDSERVGDVALLLSSDGSLYISRRHFCVGLPEPPDGPRPKDLTEFLKAYEAKQWRKLPGG